MKNFTFLFIILAICTVTSVNAQKTYTDDFSVAHNYAKDGVAGTIWDGLKVNKGFLTVEAVAEITALNTTDSVGALSFATVYSSWAGDNDNGAFLYKNVAADSDFEVTVKIAGGDFSSNGATAVAYLMAGPMVRRADTISFLAVQAFDQFSVGYGLRSLPADLSSTAAEENWTSTNDDGDDLTTKAFPYLKLARKGSVYTASCSADGKIWFDYQENERPDLAGHALQVGLYNATYTENAGKAIFDDFKLVDPKATNVSVATLAEANPIKVYSKNQSIVVKSSKTINSMKLIGLDGSVKMNMKAVNASSTTIPVEKSGVYILVAVSNGKTYTQKVIVY